MSYWVNCKKCNKELQKDEYRYQLPDFLDNEYLCSDCSGELAELVNEWIGKKEK